MKSYPNFVRKTLHLSVLAAGAAACFGIVAYFTQPSQAGDQRTLPRHGAKSCQNCVVPEGMELSGEPGGIWYWMRSPDEEKRVIMGLYNRYCIRCHGVDGRGVWDIPDVPDFTNARWQACHSDGQLTRSIMEGRGACMPPFRGTLTLEEGCAMARYLRTFIPGTEASRPDVGQPDKPTNLEPLPPPRSVDKQPK
ncbi:MAG TPA: cytochrome c [Gemmataceae bacterium]|nr:cytochrome c [Gemmataceae bacterium]